jgi:anaerobic sulfite reductase subunit A
MFFLMKRSVSVAGYDVMSLRAREEVKMSSVQDKAGTASARANVYHLLSKVYIKEVSPEFLKALKDEEMLATLSELGVDINKISDIEEKELLDALAEEYAALFILPGGLSPHESVRLKGLLCQEPESEVIDFYKRCGLVLKEDTKIFADHLGMELDFMGYLADKETDALKDKDEKEALKWRGLQKEFFDEHINKWVFGYLDDLDKFSRHPFYSEMSKLTRGFLEVERGELEAWKSPT